MAVDFSQAVTSVSKELNKEEEIYVTPESLALTFGRFLQTC